MLQSGFALAALSLAPLCQGHVLSSTASPRIVPLTFEEGFWFGPFDVGLSKNLSLLIDTGSSDVVVNPGLYKPSPQSQKLKGKAELDYATADSNGCGFADIEALPYTDSMSFAGYVAKNQTLGTVVKAPPPNNATITKFPGQGIVGFLGAKASSTVLGGVPFFQNLCNEKVVPECRFGIALGTEGTGKQVVGGFDSSMFKGKAVTVPLYHKFEWVISGGLDRNLVKHQTFLQRHILLDVGTSNIVGNRTLVQALFEKLGIQPYESNLAGCAGTLFGSYPCDAPPEVGFHIGDNKELFTIEPSAFKLQDNGNNNCTTTITGADDYPGWIMGQSWMQGKYLDFDVTNRQFTIANLK